MNHEVCFYAQTMQYLLCRLPPEVPTSHDVLRCGFPPESSGDENLLGRGLAADSASAAAATGWRAAHAAAAVRVCGRNIIVVSWNMQDAYIGTSVQPVSAFIFYKTEVVSISENRVWFYFQISFWLPSIFVTQILKRKITGDGEFRVSNLYMTAVRKFQRKNLTGFFFRRCLPIGGQLAFLAGLYANPCPISSLWGPCTFFCVTLNPGGFDYRWRHILLWHHTPNWISKREFI